MKRAFDWEDKLTETLQRHMALPSEYGVSDCYILADDCVYAMTGERINDALVGGYSNEIGAAKLLMREGFNDVSDAFGARFETVPAMLAQRGDIGVMLNDGQVCGGVFTALGFAVRDKDSVLFVSSNDVKTAYKVAR